MRRPLVTALLLSGLLAAGSAPAAVVPDPGGAGAWATGTALLADAPGPLALFDQPGRVGARSGRVTFAAQRARLFELDALARVRGALAWERPPWTLASGVETFGPSGFRRSRLVAGAALEQGGGSLGAAWSERRSPPALGRGRAGSLDVSAAAILPGTRGRLRAQLSTRSLLGGGDPDASADPDWTIEAMFELGPARAHLARTRDLHGARTGGGVALGSGRLSLSAGAVGPPASWTIGVAIGARAGKGAARAGFARVVHPVLGASDLVEGGVSW